MTEQVNTVPSLRFPEFDGEWEWKKLGSLGSFKGGGTPDKSVAKYWMGDIPWVSSSDIKEGDIHNIEVSRFITDEAVKESATKVVPKGSVLFVSRVGVGKLAINENEVCTSQDFTSLSPQGANSHFLGYFFLAQNNLLIRFSQGTSIKGFTKSDIETLKLHLPEQSEQQKIANFLTAVDKRIEQLEEKKRLLSEYKKGVMQQIFSQQTRFTDEHGNPYPDWQEKRLGDVCDMQAGKFVRAADIHRYQKSSLYPCFGGNGLRGFTKTFTHTGKYSLIGRQGALCGNITLAKGKFHATEHAVVTVPKEGTSVDWLFYELIHLNLNQYATGQAQPGLSVGNLGRVVVEIPKVEKEQQKIAEFLTSIDNKIEQVGAQLAQAKNFKKGLLQQMFV